MRKPYMSPSFDIENAKTYDKADLLERMKKSTVPKEFLKLWMERGVNWVEGSDNTRGHFSRDIRLNGAMLIPNYSSAMLKPEVLLDHYSTPTVRILGKDSEPAQGNVRVPKIRNRVIYFSARYIIIFIWSRILINRTFRR